MYFYKSTFTYSLLLALCFGILFTSCGDDDPVDPVDEGCQITDCNDNNLNTEDVLDEENCTCSNTLISGLTNYKFEADAYTEEGVQEALILMEDGDTISFGAGTYSFTNTLSLDDKNNVRILGAGIDATILDFSDQTAGAEGLKVTADQSIIANLTISNSKGDALKAKDCNHFSFINVGTVWDGEATEENGAYGLYPVTCTHILIDGCYAKGASDAGIYVGQTQNVIVRNSTADNNVAGIEIENTTNADVYDNVTINNTGGVLVFDLPGLPAGQGSHCRIFNNRIENNNYRNFAPPGNIVGSVPPGTGVMVLAAANVEIFDNTITNNNVLGIGLVDYSILAVLNNASWDDPEYQPYPSKVYVYDNDITRTNDCPESLNLIGTFIVGGFDNCDIPEIVWDGVTDLDLISGENSICIQNDDTIANMNFNDFPVNVVEPDYQGFDCEREKLPEVVVEAPML